MSGTLIEKTSHDLALAVAANIPTCGLPIEVQRHYLEKKHEIREALLRGFVLPVSEKKVTSVTEKRSTFFNTRESDLVWWVQKAEEFAAQYLGVNIGFRDHFFIPDIMPWSSAIPIFDPGGEFTNQKAVELLKRLGIAVLQEVNLMRCSGSGAVVEPTLRLVQNSIMPDQDTMGMTANQMYVTGKSWLDLRGYALMFGFYYFAKREHLDTQTFTCFPNSRIRPVKVLDGYWNAFSRKLKFGCGLPNDSGSCCGARLAISCLAK